MRKISAYTTIITMLLTIAAQAGTYTGPDQLNNNWSNWSISGTGSVMKSRVGSTLQLGIFNYVVFNMNWSATATASRTVSVVEGKRYQYDVTGKRTRSVWKEPVSSSWWTEMSGYGSTSASSSSSYSTKSITAVASSSSLSLRCRSTLSGNTPGEADYCYGEFSTATLRQVIYDPQMAISQTALRVNTDNPGGSTANISLDLQSLSYADEPTSSSMDWGDGAMESNPTLNASHGHAYSITNGDSATWTATLNGSNEAGSGVATAAITMLRQPDIALTVAGLSATDGGTIQYDITKNPTLNLSLLSSLGYIEQAEFSIPERLNLTGTDRTFSGSIFNTMDIGQTFQLTAMISNTGSGINADSLTMNIEVVPEPATLSLLIVGGLAIIRRRRQVT